MVLIVRSFFAFLPQQGMPSLVDLILAIILCSFIPFFMMAKKKTNQSARSIIQPKHQLTNPSPEDVFSISSTAAVAHTIEAIMEAINVPLLMAPMSSLDFGVDLGRPDDELPDEVTQARPSPWEAAPRDDTNKVPPLPRHNAIVPKVRTKFCAYAWL
jgi:hypothetical protein